MLNLTCAIIAPSPPASNSVKTEGQSLWIAFSKGGWSLRGAFYPEGQSLRGVFYPAGQSLWGAFYPAGQSLRLTSPYNLGPALPLLVAIKLNEAQCSFPPCVTFITPLLLQIFLFLPPTPSWQEAGKNRINIQQVNYHKERCMLLPQWKGPNSKIN